MKHVWFLYALVLVLGGVTLSSGLARAASAPLLITELQVGSDSSASDEMAEIYNPTASDVDISGWGLYYKSATGKTWYKKATIPTGSVLKSHGYWVVASQQAADSTMSSGMAQTSGVVQIRNVDGEVVSTLGWGSADTAEGQPAASPASGEVLYRKYDQGTERFSSSQNNHDDFELSQSATPHAATIVAPENDTTANTYPAILINELLPDPVSPLTDSKDEFIELYNPNLTAVSLNGWRLRDAGGGSFTIGDVSIEPNGFVSFKSEQTKLSLNNSGDVIELVNPDGVVMDRSEDYGAARAGLSWGLYNGDWAWLNVPTAAAANSVVAPEETTTDSSNKSSSTSKTKAAKAAAVKSSKASTSKTKQAASPKTPAAAIHDAATEASKNPSFWGWLLALAGIATIGYGIYEYRTEITNLYHRCREALIARRANRGGV